MTLKKVLLAITTIIFLTSCSGMSSILNIHGATPKKEAEKVEQKSTWKMNT